MSSIWPSAALNPRTEISQGVRAAARLQKLPEAAKAAIVIPTLREAENVPVLLERIRKALDTIGIDYEILIVDDNSCDGIEKKVLKISREDPRVRFFVRRGKRGLSGAVLHGWMRTDAPIVGVMDADLQHPPEVLPDLLAMMLGGCDLVIGSRYSEGGGLGSWNTLRRLISTAAVWATWPVQRRGLRAKDPLSGFFFVRRDCLNGIEFQEEGFKLLLEVLVRARIGTLREVPIDFGQRLGGASKANLKVALEYVKLLARLYGSRFGWKRSEEASPVRSLH